MNREVAAVSEALLSLTDAGGLQCFPLRASPHPSPPPRRGNMRLDSSLCNPRPLWEREQLCLSCAKTTNAGEGMNPLEKKTYLYPPSSGLRPACLTRQGKKCMPRQIRRGKTRPISMLKVKLKYLP